MLILLDEGHIVGDILLITDLLVLCLLVDAGLVLADDGGDLSLCALCWRSDELELEVARRSEGQKQEK